MSSQDSQEECPVSSQPFGKNIFKDTYPYMWFSDEEDEAELVPPRFKHESRAAWYKRIINLEMRNDELRIDNFTLWRKLEKEKDKPTTSSPPPSSSPKETWVHGMDTPLGLCQAWGRCPGIVSPPLSLPLSILVRSLVILWFSWIRV